TQVVRYAVRLADATRHPERYGLPELSEIIEVGASPRGPIGLIQAAQALAVLRGRDYVTARDVHDLAADVLRHRMVLSYEAHADGITSDQVLDRIMAAVDPRAVGSGGTLGGAAGVGGGYTATGAQAGQPGQAGAFTSLGGGTAAAAPTQHHPQTAQHETAVHDQTAPSFRKAGER
ncbi:MAG: hypothetical protein Q7T55_24060, partial [Solirubrobacteraceae bacterium]|nr:hypothetical protein [Solirubrobacteraceae bacterium]